MKNKTVKIYCKNTKQYHTFPIGTSLLEIHKTLKIDLKYPVVAARVNYKVESLNFLIYKPKDIEFIDASIPSGMRVYVRSLSMVLSKAVAQLFPSCVIEIAHPISKGYYCVIYGRDESLQSNEVEQIKALMKQIIAIDEPFVMEEKQTHKLMEIFQNKKNNTNKDNLFETLGEVYTPCYQLGDYIDYYLGELLPSTGYLDIFDLTPYYDGMLLQIPDRTDPIKLEKRIEQPKMFEIFKEYLQWNRIMGFHSIGDFNKLSKRKMAFNMIKVAEAFHEKKVADIADRIRKQENIKVILISGPSSSGKTTFSKRLSIQLMVAGLKPKILSMDNYFVNRVDTPLDENGQWDFESIDAVDVPLFNIQLSQLLEGKTVEIPCYNFERGERETKGELLTLEEDTVLIMEGIHALNPLILQQIQEDNIFKIYVSALTTISIDEHNWIPTSDVRLIRRIIRDYQFRNYSAQETIRRWPSVRRGEDKWIYPYQENADVMFNSALIFELAVLKQYAIPILEQVPKYCDEYTEAHRLIKFLRYFTPIKHKEIPPTSLLREFLGGSSFRY